MVVLWDNRIVDSGLEPPEELRANARNWRLHTAHQSEALTDALGEIGWVGRVIVNLRTGEDWPEEQRGIKTLVDGHLRVKLALDNHQPAVPVDYVDLSPVEEDLVLVTLDPLAGMVEVDAVKLLAIARDLRPEGEALDRLVADMMKEADALLKEPPPVPMDQEGEGESLTSYTCPKCGFEFHVS